MPQKRKNKFFGTFGENLAVKLLQNKGYKIIGRNFRSRFGEIDLIAEDGGVLVFVEVKTRFSNKFGEPEEAVTPWKIEKIKKAGEYFCLTHPNKPKKLRIDVVAIQVSGNRIKSVKIIKVI